MTGFEVLFSIDSLNPYHFLHGVTIFYFLIYFILEIRKMRLKMFWPAQDCASEKWQDWDLHPHVTLRSVPLAAPCVCQSLRAGSVGPAMAGLWSIRLGHFCHVGRPRDCFLPPNLLIEAESRKSSRSEIGVNSLAVRTTLNHLNSFSEAHTQSVWTRQNLGQEGSGSGCGGPHDQGCIRKPGPPAVAADAEGPVVEHIVTLLFVSFSSWRHNWLDCCLMKVSVPGVRSWAQKCWGLEEDGIFAGGKGVIDSDLGPRVSWSPEGGFGEREEK